MYIINQNNEKIINTDNVRSIWPDGCRIIFSLSLSMSPGGSNECQPMNDEEIAFANEDNASKAYSEIEKAIFDGCRALQLSEAFISPEEEVSCENDNEPQLFVDRAE